MIPLRVRLKGFLCYKDEQEISFEGAPLWMLAGLNGSGKSAVFDAVTYALFGHHRGGSQHAHELINKNSDSLVVEFDFLQDGQAFRARRTLQRNARGSATGTQQAFCRKPANGDNTGGWEPIAGTSRRAEFEAWVRDIIGLSYEIFTSSVLLLQNKAEKLLDSTAKGRFEVLAGIVDLDRYERLHQLGDERRKASEAEVKSLTDHLAVLPEVGALLLVEAESRIASAEAARQKSQEEVDRLQEAETASRRWADLQDRLVQASRRWQQAERLLAEGAAIERDLARLHELRIVLPHLQTAVEQRGQIQQSDRQAAEIDARRHKQQEHLIQQDAALEQVRQKRAVLEGRIAEEERRHRQASADFRKAAALLERLMEYERQEADLSRLVEELARLPANPQANVDQARKKAVRLEAAASALPLLTRFQEQREVIRHAQAREKEALDARQKVEAQGKQCAADVEHSRPQLAAAELSRHQADEEAIRTRTLLDEACRQLADLGDLGEAKVCPHCGQPLTAAHLSEEKDRRQKLVAEAKTRQEKASIAQKSAQSLEQTTRELLTRLDGELGAFRERFVELRHVAEQAHRDVERLETDCGQIHALLNQPFRGRVARTPPSRWLETTYPTTADLEGLQQEAAEVAAGRQRLQEAEEVLQTWSQRKAQEETIRQTLARMEAELPADRAAMRRQHAKLESEDDSLDAGLAARRAELAATQKDLERLSREREQTQQQITSLQGQLNTEEARRQHCRQARARALKDLPPAWHGPAQTAGLADLDGWAQERDALVARQVEESGRQLAQARMSVDVVKQELAGLEDHVSHVPISARQEPARVQAQLQQARQANRGRDDELGQARREHTLLEERRMQREQLEAKLLEAQRMNANWRTLAELLGRERLQLHLVRQAERQVVDHANAVLDRLSGGELFLRLVGEAGGDGSGARALELEAHNRATGEQPINVAFLSGSQKFRVAVSVALGIGQYASSQHRPLESVIIDEGFGCLDRNGRQVMIQELQNLRSHLSCILLVSHQEEFADAFADGYRFELQGGTTVVSRFQR
jgi:DNA repair exonuclease SbcCD ATPase subunit